MPRKGEVKRRDVLPDPKYHDRTVTKFMASMMSDGKKSSVERIFYSALDLVGDRSKEEAVGVFKRALDQVKPMVEVRSRRVGGANCQVPSRSAPRRRISLGMRWLIRTRPSKSMVKLAGGFSTPQGRGSAIRRRKTRIGWPGPAGLRPLPLVGHRERSCPARTTR
jgi:small subunit ribosomal protein S7